MCSNQSPMIKTNGKLVESFVRLMNTELVSNIEVIVGEEGMMAVVTFKEVRARAVGQKNVIFIMNYDSGNRRGSRGRSSRGRYNGPRKNDVMNFEGDFDFESSNAQFNKEDIAKELMDKLKITGSY